METLGERTQSLFEHINGYRQPPLVALPDISDPDMLRQFGLKQGILARSILQTGFRAAGWNRYVSSLQRDLEGVLRNTDTRAFFFPPVISATLAFIADPRPLTPWQRAASLTLAARSLYEDIWTATLPQDEHKGAPLEMGQYPNLFSTSMVVDGDRLQLRKGNDCSSIAVVSRGEIYVLRIWDGERNLRLSELAKALEDISTGQARTSSGRPAPSIGLLTAASDNKQIEYFSELARNEQNQKSLTVLHDVFFTVCLDLETEPKSPAEAARVTHFGNPSNRWYHSSLQLVVFGNSMAASIYSFRAWLDGNAMSRSAAEICRRAAAIDFNDDEKMLPDSAVITATRTNWEIKPEFLQEAQADLDRLIDDDQPSTFVIKGIGSRQLSGEGLAPVPVFVVALALAVLRLKGRVPTIKQFVTMSKYRCVGVKTAMIVAPEVVRCVERLRAPEGSDEESLLQDLRRAVEAQEKECSLVRRSLSIEDVQALFRHSRTGLRGRLSAKIEKWPLALLRRLHLYCESHRDILISHPAIHPEIPVLGRPGVRTTYLRYLTLHYAIESDHITCTVTKGSEWNIPNRRFMQELETALGQVSCLLESAKHSEVRNEAHVACEHQVLGKAVR